MMHMVTDESKVTRSPDVKMIVDCCASTVLVMDERIRITHL